MMAEDEDALVCDFAETYHILDYRALPVRLQAVLASGLREDSRIKMKLGGMKKLPMEMVAVKTADELSLIRYALTAKDDTPKPDLFSDYMTGKEKEQKTGFMSIEDFESARARFLKGEDNG